MDGRDIEDELNSEEVNRAVSLVARVPAVRERLVAVQRAIGRAHPVMEGRDIGTVVFPDAAAKFYIDASKTVRAHRRGLQGQADTVRERDRIDTTRKTAPLIAAPDAMIIDSSNLALDEVISRVMDELRTRGLLHSEATHLLTGSATISTSSLHVRFSIIGVIGGENLSLPGGALIAGNHDVLSTRPSLASRSTSSFTSSVAKHCLTIRSPAPFCVLGMPYRWTRIGRTWAA